MADELKARFDAGFSSSDKESIAELYREVLHKELKRTNCNDCYRDALIEVYHYLKTEKKMKEKCAYSLLAGVIIQDFENGKVYTNANLSDEVAEGYLKRFPRQIQMFAKYPENWEERIGKVVEELNEELVSEMAERLEEGTTKRQIREDYKGYLLDGKKLTNKQIDMYLKAASDFVGNRTEIDELTVRTELQGESSKDEESEE